MALSTPADPREAALSARKDDVVELDAYRKPPEGAAGEILQVPLDLIDVDANVRVNVASIEELAASIAEHGVRQPISLRDVAGDRYAINFGQRRYLASKMAGRTTIPAFVDNEARSAEQLAIHQLVENLAREDLPPLDRARAMKTVVDAGMSQAELARQLGLGATTVTNDLRLLEASPAVHAALEAGQITASHAKALLPLPAKEQDYFIGRIKSGGLSAHRLEEEVGWKLQTIRGEEARVARTTKQAPKLVAALEAAKVAKSTTIRLRTPYNMDEHALGAAVKKAGWTKLAYGYATPRGPEAKCDCDVVLVEFNRSWKLEAACVEYSHRDRQVNADHVADEKRRKAVQAKVQRLKVAIATVIERSAVPHQLVRLMAASRNDLAEQWEAEDLGLVVATAARNLAQTANSEYVWGDEARKVADANLDEAVAAFEALAGTEPPAMVQEADGTKTVPSAAFGHIVVDEEASEVGRATRYRVSKVTPHALHLAPDTRQWRNAPIVALADPSKLSWTLPDKVWAGPTIAAEASA